MNEPFNVFLNNGWQWSVRCQLLLTTVVVSVLFLLGYWLELKPINQRLEALRNETITLNQAIQINQQARITVVAYQAQLQDMKLPLDAAMIPWSRVLESISELALTNGLLIESLVQERIVTTTWSVARPLQLHVVGSFRQLTTFLNQLVETPVTLHDVVVSTMADNKQRDQLRMELTICLHRLGKEPSIDV